MIGAPEMGSMPTPGPVQALTFNNINRLGLLGARANPICGHPNGLPRKDPSSGSHGAGNRVLGGYLGRGRNGFGMIAGLSRAIPKRLMPWRKRWPRADIHSWILRQSRLT